MTSGYGEKERAFLETLETDTGRTLEEWMAAITAEGFAERNDVIDWLRRQGFRFSRASWLERVHHNGGKPIYAGRPPTDRATARRTLRDASSPSRQPQQTAVARTAAPVLGMSFIKPASTPPSAPSAPRPASEAYAAAAPANVVPLTFADPLSTPITELTSKAKAYRPLADYLLREIAKAVPSAVFSLRGNTVIISRAREFASLAISSRELKLTVGTSSPALPLTDARQVDSALIDRVKAAASTAN